MYYVCIYVSVSYVRPFKNVKSTGCGYVTHLKSCDLMWAGMFHDLSVGLVSVFSRNLFKCW